MYKTRKYSVTIWFKEQSNWDLWKSSLSTAMFHKKNMCPRLDFWAGRRENWLRMLRSHLELAKLNYVLLKNLSAGFASIHLLNCGLFLRLLTKLRLISSCLWQGVRIIMHIKSKWASFSIRSLHGCTIIKFIWVLVKVDLIKSGSCWWSGFLNTVKSSCILSN